MSTRPGQLLMPVPVPPPQRGVLPGLLQAFLAVFAQGLRQPVPDAAALAVLGDQDRLVGQRGQQLQQVPGCQPVIGADPLDRVQLKPAGEHRQPRPQQPLRLAAQLIAPLDRRSQRLLPAGLARLPRVSSPSRSPSRASICAGESIRARAAASSRASGRPSSRRQIPATAAMFASVTENPGTTCSARSANKVTAGNRVSCASVSCLCPGPAPAAAAPAAPSPR